MEKAHSCPEVTSWCSITVTTFVGPCLLCDTMNAARYLEVLQDHVWLVISQRKSTATLNFMQDWAPPHFANAFCTWLHDHFPGQWTGRCGVHEWPPHSPDVTLCDFFLWVAQGTSLLQETWNNWK